MMYSKPLVVSIIAFLALAASAQLDEDFQLQMRAANDQLGSVQDQILAAQQAAQQAAPAQQSAGQGVAAQQTKPDGQTSTTGKGNAAAQETKIRPAPKQPSATGVDATLGKLLESLRQPRAQAGQAAAANQNAGASQGSQQLLALLQAALQRGQQLGQMGAAQAGQLMQQAGQGGSGALQNFQQLLQAVRQSGGSLGQLGVGQLGQLGQQGQALFQRALQSGQGLLGGFPGQPMAQEQPAFGQFGQFGQLGQLGSTFLGAGNRLFGQAGGLAGRGANMMGNGMGSLFGNRLTSDVERLVGKNPFTDMAGQLGSGFANGFSQSVGSAVGNQRQQQSPLFGLLG